MRLTTGIVGHANFTVALLHHIAEFFEAKAEVVAGSDFAFFKMPQARKNALHNLAEFCAIHPKI